MTRHKHADLIHAWAEGAQVQFKDLSGKWIDVVDSPRFFEDTEYRIKPKGPDWWDNLPEHGILVRNKNSGNVRLLLKVLYPSVWEPLNNEEIEALKR